MACQNLIELFEQTFDIKSLHLHRHRQEVHIFHHQIMKSSGAIYNGDPINIVMSCGLFIILDKSE